MINFQCEFQKEADSKYGYYLSWKFDFEILLSQILDIYWTFITLYVSNSTSIAWIYLFVSGVNRLPKITTFSLYDAFPM